MDARGEAKPGISVAGAGNWLLTHDDVGPRVLERIRGRYGPSVELCDLGSAGLALLDHLHGQELLVVVDACLLEGPPGAVHELEPSLDGVEGRGASVHQIGPLETLAAARQLFPEQMPARIVLLLVETEGIDDEGLERACDEVVARLDRLIEQATADHAGSPDTPGARSRDATTEV